MILPLVLFALDAATVAVPADAATACAHPDPNQIMVCGHAIEPGRYCLPALPPVAEPTGPPRAE